MVSKSGRNMIDSFNLYKKKDILKTEFVMISERDDETLDIKRIIKKLESEGVNEARLDKDFPSSGTHNYIFKFSTFINNDEIFYILNLEDITEIKEYEEEMAINKFKSLMLASLTHEIRTPLNAIINSCDIIMMDNDSTTGIMECIEICKSSASLLMYMTYNLLDYSRMEAGEFREERMPFVLSTLLEKVAIVSEPHARLKNLTFELEIDEDLEFLKVMNDQRRIIQVLVIIITNAIKYTSLGKVRLKINQF